MKLQMPQPNQEQAAHTNQLRQLICQRVDQQGPLTLAEYMEIALYEPGLGYYRCGTQKFGAAGDFVTAPELSPLFALCLAQRCRQLLNAQHADVLEIGAGSGMLAVALLLALEKQNSLPAHYNILELSSELQARQSQLIAARAPHLVDRVVWLDRWPPAPFHGVVIANELFDAMPVHKFVIERGIKEYFVTHQDGKLTWQVDEPSTPKLASQLRSYDINFATGYTSEINLLLPGWIKGLCDCLGQAHLIFIDYGYKREAYYHPERSMGTLMCHFQHRAHDDPLRYPGIQDITTHVDFTLLAESAVAAGCQVVGFNTQAQYLLEHGAMQLLSQETDPHRYARLAQEVKQLVLPNQMGESFKVLELVYE